MSACVVLRGTRVSSIYHRLAVPSLSCQCNHQLQIVRGKKHFQKKNDPRQSSNRDIWLPKTGVQSSKNTLRKMPTNYDKFLTRQPEDDVWIRTYFPPPKYSLEEAVELHREVACPEMADNMEGLIVLNFEMNMATSKVTKFVSAFRGLMILPHNFDDGTVNKVLAFCKTKDEEKAALEAGAEFAGGADLMTQIISGDIRPYMFDHVVCTSDFHESTTKARKHLREKYPGRGTDAVGPDVTELVKHFRKGKNFECVKENDNFGRVTVNIGKLNMPTNELLENFQAYISRVNKFRTTRVGNIGGNFISKAFLTCPPLHEKVHIDDQFLAMEKKSKYSILLGDDEEGADDVANTAQVAVH